MKNAIIAIVIFGLGALFYALLSSFFTAPKADVEVTDQTPSSTLPAVIEEEETSSKAEEEKVESPVVVTDDGSQLDGPFPILNEDGEETGATVRIIRSPEEMLLQFEHWDEEYPLASHVYFASDLNASEFLNLGPAEMSDDYLIYGIPLDADLSAYNYVLVYQTQLDETEYYAKIR